MRLNKEKKSLSQILKKHEKDTCSECDREIVKEDCSWTNGETEWGTPHSTLSIDCICGENILFIATWWPSIDSFDEFLDVLEENIRGERP
jgi:hypothetical protein